MLKIEPRFVETVRNATHYGTLADVFQQAIKLELSTIPPYLTAMISLKRGGNDEIRAIIRSVVVQEMLHLGIAANIVTALGGSPKFDDPAEIPTYPTSLPMGIGDGLVVALEAYSADVVRSTFMEIEEPETPLEFPIAADVIVPDFSTIGEFYTAMQEKIQELGPDLPGDATRQVTGLFAPDELFPILKADDAVAGVGLIIAQGEGSTTSPLDPDGTYAHYYRFEELAVGRHLVVDPTTPKGYSFSGAMIPFDPTGVWPLHANTKAAQLPAGSEARHLADQFNAAYSRLLVGLHRSFNGDPAFLSSTLSLMYDITLFGERLASYSFPGIPGSNVGPPFEYVPI